MWVSSDACRVLLLVLRAAAIGGLQTQLIIAEQFQFGAVIEVAACHEVNSRY